MKKVVLILFALLISVGFAFANDADIKQLTKAANKGKAEAQNELGQCYFHGDGVEQDYDQAAYWWQKAAEQGHVTAQNNLGLCYYAGFGVTQDYKQAFDLYLKAAKQGNPMSQYMLGLCYKNGQGVPTNYKLAYMWSILSLPSISESVIQDALKKMIKELELKMTKEQTIEAQDMATEWFEKFEKSKK